MVGRWEWGDAARRREKKSGGAVNVTLRYVVRKGSSTIKSGIIGTVTIHNNEDKDFNLTLNSIVFGSNLEAGTYDLYIVNDEVNYQGRSVSIYCPTGKYIAMNCKYSIIPFKETQTIIGLDGLISYKDGDHYFIVDDSGTNQKIITQGLGTTKSQTDGELYVSNNFINAFKSFCDIVDSAFQDARFEGSNRDYADEISAAVQAIKTSLDDSALVAVS